MAAQIFTAPIEESDLPAAKGAYALLIRLPRRLRISVGALGPVDLPGGDYLYLGSAYGPGGLRARLRRHLRASKKAHWHVDYLTVAGSVVRVLVLPSGNECDLVTAAGELPGVSIPFAGFGSTDCARCSSHLLSIGVGSRSVLSALAGSG